MASGGSEIGSGSSEFPSAFFSQFAVINRWIAAGPTDNAGAHSNPTVDNCKLRKQCRGNFRGSVSSEIRDNGNTTESRGTHPERVADHLGLNMPGHPFANNNPNGHGGRDHLERSFPGFLAYSGLAQFEGEILQVHSQGLSPFITHPALMWTYLSSVVICYGATLYYGKCWFTGSRCPEICELVGNISGSLASAAFLAILVPPSLVPLVFVIWVLHVLVYVDVARKLSFNLAKKLYGYLSNGAVYVLNIWNRVTGNNNERATNPEEVSYEL